MFSSRGSLYKPLQTFFDFYQVTWPYCILSISVHKNDVLFILSVSFLFCFLPSLTQAFYLHSSATVIKCLCPFKIIFHMQTFHSCVNRVWWNCKTEIRRSTQHSAEKRGRKSTLTSKVLVISSLQKMGRKTSDVISIAIKQERP